MILLRSISVPKKFTVALFGCVRNVLVRDREREEGKGGENSISVCVTRH